MRAERSPRRFLVGALLVLSLACFAGSLSHGWMLALCLAVYAPASGVACALAQSELVARSGESRERALTHWTLAGAAGDFAAIGLLSLVALGSLGLRAAFAVCGAYALVQAALAARTPLALAVLAEDEEPRERPLFHRRLIAWSLALTLCCLLDEIVIAFGAFHLTERFGAGVHVRNLVLGAWVAGGFVGIAIADRLLTRIAPMRLLAASGALGAILYPAWISAGSVAASVPLAFLAGVANGPLYPLAKAQAYACLPDRPAIVNALDSLFAPIEWIVWPIAIGLLAAHASLDLAMAALAIEPLGLFALAMWELRRNGGR